jgi:hypothetical protein
VWQAAMVSGAKWRTQSRPAVRRTGLVTLALLFGSVAAALLLAHRFQRGLAQTLTTALVGGGTLPGLYLAWAAYRFSATSAKTQRLNLTEVADELAVAIRRQWQAEAELRRLNDPYPMPVSWVAADASLADDWHSLMKLASTGAGWPLPPLAGIWASEPAELAGSGNELIDVLARVPTGRLIVLGEPGAGKTMRMIRLVLDMLARRVGGAPVPC